VNRELGAEDMDAFFKQIAELETHYTYWTNEVPKRLVINPDIIGKLARIPGFYQRPELQSEVTLHAPVVRYLKLANTVVTLQEDYDEKYLHFE
jgi:hypothetical protein